MAQARNYYYSFVKDNALTILGHLITYLKGILIIPVVVKSVGTATFGAYALVNSLFGIIYAVSTLGVGFKARRYLPSSSSPLQRRQLFYPQFYFNILVLLILCGAFSIFSDPLDKLAHNNEIDLRWWLVPVYLYSYLVYYQATKYYQNTSRIRTMVTATIVFPYLHIALVVIHLWIFGSVTLNILVALGALSAAIVGFPLLFKIVREIGLSSILIETSALSSDLRLGAPLVLGLVIDFVLAAGDRFLIAGFLSVSSVGVYVPAYTVGTSIILLPKALNSALPQLLSRCIDNGDQREARKMLDYAVRGFLVVAVPFICGAVVLSQDLLTVLTNSDIAEEAYLVVPVVGLGVTFYGLGLLYSRVFFVKLQTTEIFRMNLYATIVCLALNVLLLYWWEHILASAFSTLVSYILSFVYAVRRLPQDWRLTIEKRFLLKLLVASVLMGMVLAVIGKEGPVTAGETFAKIVLGVAVFGMCAFGLRVFSAGEIEFLRQLMRARNL